MGEDDWVRHCDEDYGKIVIDSRKANKDETIPEHERGKYWYCQGAGHNMHMDNPREFARIIIKELLGEDLE